MFGLFKKPCEHKKKQYTNMNITHSLPSQEYSFAIIHPELINNKIKIKIYYCEYCGVLFVPIDKKKKAIIQE